MRSHESPDTPIAANATVLAQHALAIRRLGKRVVADIVEIGDEPQPLDLSEDRPGLPNFLVRAAP